jgi:hypothetical protein
MRRLAILFAVIAMLSAFEHVVLPGALTVRWNTLRQTPRRLGRVWRRLSDWRAFLIGPIRLFQRAAPRNAAKWLGVTN